MQRGRPIRRQPRQFRKGKITAFRGEDFQQLQSQGGRKGQDSVEEFNGSVARAQKGRGGTGKKDGPIS